uniref:Uncharacterized protein n=1 Tax=Anguilla anguilla TaxID=7936 RepID=A0A0E9PG87_ANGAN
MQSSVIECPANSGFCTHSRAAHTSLQ